MSWLAVTKLLGRAGRWIASSRLAQGMAAVGAFLIWLKWKLIKAEKQGRDDERERINRESEREEKRIRERAHEVDERYRDSTDDELRDRLRKRATDHDDQP